MFNNLLSPSIYKQYVDKFKAIKTYKGPVTQNGYKTAREYLIITTDEYNNFKQIKDNEKFSRYNLKLSHQYKSKLTNQRNMMIFLLNYGILQVRRNIVA